QMFARDWSSDVCSSDLSVHGIEVHAELLADRFLVETLLHERASDRSIEVDLMHAARAIELHGASHALRHRVVKHDYGHVVEVEPLGTTDGGPMEPIDHHEALEVIGPNDDNGEAEPVVQDALAEQLHPIRWHAVRVVQVRGHHGCPNEDSVAAGHGDFPVPLGGD